MAAWSLRRLLKRQDQAGQVRLHEMPLEHKPVRYLSGKPSQWSVDQHLIFNRPNAKNRPLEFREDFLFLHICVVESLSHAGIGRRATNFRLNENRRESRQQDYHWKKSPPYAFHLPLAAGF